MLKIPGLNPLLEANANAFAYSMQGKDAYNKGLEQYTTQKSQANAKRREAQAVTAIGTRNQKADACNAMLGEAAARARGDQGLTQAGGLTQAEKLWTQANVQKGMIANAEMSRAAGSLRDTAMTMDNQAMSALHMAEAQQRYFSSLAKTSKTVGWLKASAELVGAIGAGVEGFQGAQDYNNAANEFNEMNGLSEGMDGYKAQQNPYKAAFLSGLGGGQNSGMGLQLGQLMSKYRGGSSNGK